MDNRRPTNEKYLLPRVPCLPHRFGNITDGDSFGLLTADGAIHELKRDRVVDLQRSNADTTSTDHDLIPNPDSMHGPAACLLCFSFEDNATVHFEVVNFDPIAINGDLGFEIGCAVKVFGEAAGNIGDDPLGNRSDEEEPHRAASVLKQTFQRCRIGRIDLDLRPTGIFGTLANMN